MFNVCNEMFKVWKQLETCVMMNVYTEMFNGCNEMFQFMKVYPFSHGSGNGSDCDQRDKGSGMQTCMKSTSFDLL